MTEMMEQLSGALGDRYEVRRELGAGGMAVVFLAEDVRHHRQVAVKVLRPELARTVGADRFNREIDIVAQMQHPHILPLHDSGEVDGMLYYVMPFIEGKSLRDRLRQGPLDLVHALQYAGEIASALSYAHSVGLVHRDIKPENVLLSRGHAMVADFGIAAIGPGSSDQQLTETGAFIGTPSYMCPEQINGTAIGPAADQYALACVVFEMLTGRMAFGGPSLESVFNAHCTQPAPSVVDERPETPEAVDAALRRALAKDPEDRFADMAEFRAALGGHVPARAVRTARGGAGVAAAAVAIAALSLMGWFWSNAPDDAERVAVLPFANLGDPQDAYVADGVTEALTSRLAGTGAMPLVSRQSALRYRGTTMTPEQIGAELGARYLVTGSVLRERPGDPTARVRISSELVQARTNVTVWGSSFDLGLERLFDAFSDIGEEVASALEIRLDEADRVALAAAPTAKAGALDLYFRGRAALDAGGVGSGVETAVAWLDSATGLDDAFLEAREAAWVASAFNGVERPAPKGTADRNGVPDEVERAATALRMRARGDWESAATILAELGWRHPANAPVVVEAARTLFGVGRTVEAIDVVTWSIRHVPFNAAVWEARIWLTVHGTESLQPARRLLARAEPLVPPNRLTNVANWVSILDGGPVRDWAEPGNTMRPWPWRSTDPNRVPMERPRAGGPVDRAVWLERAGAMAARGDAEAARRALEAGIDEGGERMSGVDWWRVAWIRLQVGDRDGAADALRRLMAGPPPLFVPPVDRDPTWARLRVQLDLAADRAR